MSIAELSSASHVNDEIEGGRAEAETEWRILGLGRKERKVEEEGLWCVSGNWIGRFEKRKWWWH